MGLEHEVRRAIADTQRRGLRRDLGAPLRPLLHRTYTTAVKADVARRRITAPRIDFIDGQVACPFCGTKVNHRHVTREHLDVPPNPPYAASLVCPNDKEHFEVVFSDS